MSSDNWEGRFDQDWGYLNHPLPSHSGRTAEIKQFIRDNFIPREDVERAIEEAQISNFDFAVPNPSGTNLKIKAHNNALKALKQTLIPISKEK